ncbi:MAG: adenosylhomocysteinase [Actinomycetales bacterium]
MAQSCRLLQSISSEFAQTRPFENMMIGTGIHLEPKTVALLLTLQVGGARVIATGNLNTTQPEAVAYLAARNVEVVGRPTSDPAEHDGYVGGVLSHRPDLLLDNGGDLFTRYLEAPYATLLGGTEETTSGRMRLEPLRGRLRRPILVINDSPIKQFAENEHAVGQSVFESFMRITNRATHGRRVVVFGYGACGKGVAATFRNGFAAVSVVETDPVLRLQANLDGFPVPARETALAEADIVVTVTGAEDVVTDKDLDLFKDGAILLNAGHFPNEIAVERIAADARVTTVSEPADGITTYALSDGREVHLLTGGHMVNLAGPHPLGNSIESMDLGFALQARCLEAVATGQVDPDAVVVPVPGFIDRQVAQAYLALDGPAQ